MAEPVEIAVPGGRHVFDFGKGPREMKTIAEAGGGGNLLDGDFGICEHHAGAFNALEVDVGVQRAPHLLLEQPAEGAGTHAGLPRQQGIADVGVQPVIQIFQGRQHPRIQLRRVEVI